jgi:hypothetical protein
MFKSISGKLVVAGFISLMPILFTSCAKKITFLESSVVPAARGKVRVKKDDNHNYNIQVNLTNLAEVDRLQPSKKAYIVWMVTDENLTKNIGQIKSSSGRIFKRLKASLETSSSFKPVKIFITAEDESDVQYPGSQVVLSTENF